MENKHTHLKNWNLEMKNNYTLLKKWTVPSDWFGTPWHDHYVFLGRNRDSDCLTNSNFACALEEIGGESDTVHVVNEGHWACGWIEFIAIHKSDVNALDKAEEILHKLEDYPVLDEEDYMRLEDEQAQETWGHCFDPKERIDYIRKNRSQFEFHDFRDLRKQVRGEYFGGYASELIYC